LNEENYDIIKRGGEYSNFEYVFDKCLRGN